MSLSFNYGFAGTLKAAICLVEAPSPRAHTAHAQSSRMVGRSLLPLIHTTGRFDIPWMQRSLAAQPTALGAG
ncbi:hypothetical protein CCMA1212_004541 [Trichoderma ghanense]|uniref:Uncharacterized protein n=1 Tax=Trichoderma ghanense TaxID=65468 RepID=A0ABY2H6K2_9HYPO